MIYALVEYKNEKGKIILKGVSSSEELETMIQKLDIRIEKGTCIGYIVTII